MEKLRKNLKTLRLKKGLNQTQLSKEVGLKREIYTNIESGRSNAKICDLVKLATFHKVLIDDLIGTSGFGPEERPEDLGSNCGHRVWLFIEYNKGSFSGEGSYKKGKFYMDGKDVTKDVKKWRPIPRTPGAEL